MIGGGILILAASAAVASAAEETSAEAYLQASPQDGLVSGLGARLDSGGAFLSMEARGAAGGNWIGRGTIGIDVLKRSERFDLTAGLFLGTNGSWGDPGLEMAGTAGVELGVAGHFGPVHLRYRHADGFRGPVADRLSEDEVRLGFRVFDFVELFGQYIRFNPGPADPVDGYGAGLKLVF